MSASLHENFEQQLSTPTAPTNIPETAVVGANGFILDRPFPYKNAQGDIFCIVCCLQKGELVFQPKANFKVRNHHALFIDCSL